MAIVKTKPTSPGRRHVVQVKSVGLHKGAPHAPLVAGKGKSGGRNNKGRITTRHRGGGHKQRYRVIDFKRDKDGVPGLVERLEYDPNRTAHIALIKYADGDRRWLIGTAEVDDEGVLPLYKLRVGPIDSMHLAKYTVHTIKPAQLLGLRILAEPCPAAP